MRVAPAAKPVGRYHVYSCFCQDIIERFAGQSHAAPGHSPVPALLGVPVFPTGGGERENTHAFLVPTLLRGNANEGGR